MPAQIALTPKILKRRIAVLAIAALGAAALLAPATSAGRPSSTPSWPRTGRPSCPATTAGSPSTPGRK